MGLVVQIERWPMAAAIALATEGVKANYNSGVGGGGFGAADREIGSKLDGAKVLAALDRIEKRQRHVADWCYFAYASPGWNAKQNRERLLTTLMNDWVLTNCLVNDVLIQRRTFDKFAVIVPFIAGGIALELASGASVTSTAEGPSYVPPTDKAHLISLLVDYDCEQKNEYSDGFKKKRTLYHQKHWSRWQEHIDCIRNTLMGYEKCAQAMFRKELANEMGAY
ncbi:hypothetical protein [Vibrio sp. ABG19]|uniref:hypothetical protein n=1 Tax=Vibrio sp. ABG19 TaxID=2817385 RepID=UPI00249F7CB8|nr:hypothetical protein [Vibrio sp. ABG19]WGY45046.1 hypothetical protein J0X00_04910 [Vibrio sp. ABG19]